MNQEKGSPVAREQLWQLLGGVPDTSPLKISWDDTQRGESDLDGQSVPWVRQELSYLSEPGVRVPASFFREPEAPPGPALLYLHSHSGDHSRGRDEALLGKQKVLPGLAPRLVAAGFSVLAADFRCFGDRAGEAEGESARAHLLAGSTLWGAMLRDQVRALDLLESLPEVDGDRIGCFGFFHGFHRRLVAGRP